MKEKKYFIVTLIIYMVANIILNLTVRTSQFEDVLSRINEADQKLTTSVIIISTIATFILLIIILILVKLFANISLRFILKNHYYKEEANKVFFVSVGTKFIFSIFFSILTIGLNYSISKYIQLLILTLVLGYYFFKQRREIMNLKERIGINVVMCIIVLLV